MLTSKAFPVPKVIEMLLMHVEINGLYTEGLYRKSGSACRAKELHQILETGKKKNKTHHLSTVNVATNCVVIKEMNQSWFYVVFL